MGWAGAVRGNAPFGLQLHSEGHDSPAAKESSPTIGGGTIGGNDCTYQDMDFSSTFLK